MEFGLKESCDGIPDVLRKERYLTIRGLHVLGCDEEVWLWQRRGGFDEQGHVVRHCHGDFLQPVRDVVVKTRAMIINSAEFLAPVTRLSLLESKARDDLKVTAVTLLDLSQGQCWAHSPGLDLFGNLLPDRVLQFQGRLLSHILDSFYHFQGSRFHSLEKLFLGNGGKDFETFEERRGASFSNDTEAFEAGVWYLRPPNARSPANDA